MKPGKIFDRVSMPPLIQSLPDIPDRYETRPVTPGDATAISQLHSIVFGPGRFARTAYRLREGTAAVTPYCRLAVDGDYIVATVRLTPVTVGGQSGALLLGPLAVHPSYANLGLGRRLVAEGLAGGARDGMQLVILVGDLSYYGRMGFVAAMPGQMWFAGPADPMRILVAELVDGALTRYSGLITAAT